uniref:Uncharacterized protein n=1 Tax=Romanomermis culicivorax TaxID=13658 RepID=A0A915JI64_ROMCU
MFVDFDRAMAVVVPVQLYVFSRIPIYESTTNHEEVNLSSIRRNNTQCSRFCSKCSRCSSESIWYALLRAHFFLISFAYALTRAIEYALTHAIAYALSLAWRV